MMLNPKKPQTTKEHILHALQQQWPRTAKQVYHTVQKNSSKSVTYQAVHKFLQELVTEGILEKTERSYAIRLDWIQGLRQYAETLESTYTSTRPLIEAQQFLEQSKEKTFSTTFNSIAEIDSLTMEVIEAYTEKPVYTEARHLWWVLYHMKTAETRASPSVQAVNKNIYTVCRGNTTVDQWCASLEEMLGVNTRTGVDCARDRHLIVFGDYVMEIYYPESVFQRVEEKYNKVKKVTMKERKELYEFFKELFYEPMEIPVTIYRNEILAEQIRRRVDKSFTKDLKTSKTNKKT